MFTGPHFEGLFCNQNLHVQGTYRFVVRECFSSTNRGCLVLDIDTSRNNISERVEEENMRPGMPGLLGRLKR